MRLNLCPQLAAVARALKDAAEQPLAALDHQCFDASGDRWRRFLIELKKVFKIPADAFSLLRRQHKFDVAAEAWRLESRNLGADIHPVTVRRAGWVLIDAQDGHVINSPAKNA